LNKINEQFITCKQYLNQLLNYKKINPRHLASHMEGKTRHNKKRIVKVMQWRWDD